jgi:hypothetical protein
MKNPALAEFLAHSVELESEAQDRYGELADAMEGHHNREVAAFFTTGREQSLRKPPITSRCTTV